MYLRRVSSLVPRFVPSFSLVVGGLAHLSDGFVGRTGGSPDAAMVQWLAGSGSGSSKRTSSPPGVPILSARRRKCGARCPIERAWLNRLGPQATAVVSGPRLLIVVSISPNAVLSARDTPGARPGRLRLAGTSRATTNKRFIFHLL
jgi:hypothetical protein